DHFHAKLPKNAWLTLDPILSENYQSFAPALLGDIATEFQLSTSIYAMPPGGQVLAFRQCQESSALVLSGMQLLAIMDPATNAVTYANIYPSVYTEGPDEPLARIFWDAIKEFGLQFDPMVGMIKHDDPAAQTNIVQAMGTCFLVGNDVILTARHVLDPY